jgi:A/G-specific adenine glycosylase
MEPSIERFRRDLLRWGRANRRSFPWRETNDPYQVLVAEVLLQRSRGTTVAKVFPRFVDRWPTALGLARARVPSIASEIRPLGLTRRASTLKEMANEIVELGDVPSTLDGLQALPGVGPYAAGATVAVAFGKRVPVVDGVTARVYRRYFGEWTDRSPSTDPELRGVVDRATPSKSVREWNWAVLDLAASICLPQIPRCGVCPLATHCRWSQTSS